MGMPADPIVERTLAVTRSLRDLIVTGKGQPNAKGNPQTEDEKRFINLHK